MGWYSEILGFESIHVKKMIMESGEIEVIDWLIKQTEQIIIETNQN